jgi:hypothetical protein
MSITFRSKAYDGGTSHTSLTVTEPTGAAENDVLFMWINADAGLGGFTGPTGGWTLLYSQTAGSNFHIVW